MSVSADDQTVDSEATRVLDEVVCVCSSKDAPVWATACRSISAFLPARRYTLIVPDHEVTAFREITAQPFEVVPESAYVPGIKELLKSAMPADKHVRLGWFLQQYIKLTACWRAAPGEVVLIWDADTVPLKKLRFVSPEGKLRYYKGSEHHKPYFRVISKLLGLEKVVGFSFIAQCFACRAEWVHEMVREIERIHGVPWQQAVACCADFDQTSGFSEYETLGTFIHHHHADAIEVVDAEWYRYGSSLIGGIGNLSPRMAAKLARRYDFVSFELWDDHRRRALKVVPRLLRHLLVRV